MDILSAMAIKEVIVILLEIIFNKNNNNSAKEESISKNNPNFYNKNNCNILILKIDYNLYKN